MHFDQDTITILRDAAEKAWGDDTRHPAYTGHPHRGMGQCYVTARWLVSRYGGKVARKDGHYFWLSADGKRALDLSADSFVHPPADPSIEGLRTDAEDSGLKLHRVHHTWRTGPPLYKEATHPLFAGAEVLPTDTPSPRTLRFMQRANQGLDKLDAHVAFGTEDAYPGEMPERAEQVANDQNVIQSPVFDRFLHDEPDEPTMEGVYKFVYGNGQLELSPTHSHQELAGHASIPPDHSGPLAVGYVVLDTGRATWEVKSNVSLKALERVFKDYGKQIGWRWGGITDIEGQPISDEFAPKRSFWYAYNTDEDHLYLAEDMDQVWKQAALDCSFGKVELDGEYARLRLATRISCAPAEALREWAQDYGLTLVSGNDNVLKTIEDLQEHNIYTPTPTEPDQHEYFNRPMFDERAPGGVFKCPQCAQIFPRWDLYVQHRQDEEPPGEPETHETLPPLGDQDDNFPAHFTEEDGALTNVTSGVVVLRTDRRQAARVEGFTRTSSLFSEEATNTYYTAYANGCPIGYAVVDDTVLVMAQAAVKRRGVGTALVRAAQKDHPRLSTGQSYAWQTPWLARLGFMHVAGQGAAPRWVYSAPTQKGQSVGAPVPFIYDIEKDQIHCGHPGSRHSDIVGRFTPGGIVEGIYEPNGKVIIRTMTNQPYTVRHMLELWLYTNPTFPVKSVHLRDDQGKDTRLASAQDVGGYVSSLVAADPAASAVQTVLQRAGGQVYAVGGAVRDALLGHEPKDLDLMVTRLPAETVRRTLEALPGQVLLTGNDFGVFRYKTPEGQEVEVALPRRERSTGAGHKDFDVQADPTMTPEEDLLRRDFTPNAMAVNLQTGRLLDPYGGADDIDAGQFRTITRSSLTDDPLRTVRGLVLHGRYGLHPDADTRSAMQRDAPLLAHLPAERIQAELDKLFASQSPARAIRLAHDTGILRQILPEVDDAFGYDQNNPHHERELGEHLLSVLEHTQHLSEDPDLRLAALLHDIGKPASAWVDPETGSNHYYEKHVVDHETGQEHVLGADHEQMGADMAARRMAALKYPADRTRRVSDLVSHHMYAPFTTERGARRFLARVGDHADDLLTLRVADQGGKSQYPTNAANSVDRERELLQQVRDQGHATDQASLAINGHDLIAAGLPPGPEMGQLLRQLTTEVIEDPSLNTREQLLNLAQQYAGTV